DHAPFRQENSLRWEVLPLSLGDEIYNHFSGRRRIFHKSRHFPPAGLLAPDENERTVDVTVRTNRQPYQSRNPRKTVWWLRRRRRNEAVFVRCTDASLG